MSDATAMKNEMLDIAVAAHEAGLCVLPPKQDGSKRPMKAWEAYANTSSTIEEVRKWYDGVDRTGLGIVLGAPSGGLECFEFDDLDAYRDFLDAADAAGLDELVAKIESGYLEESPNGIHWLYRCDEVAGNTKLAWKLKAESERSTEHDKWKVLIETRGQGGYAIIAPSHGGVHPSGRPYRLLTGGFDSIVKITPEERKALWELAYSLSEKTDEPFTRKEVPGSSTRDKEESEWTADRAIANPSPTTPALRNEAERPGDWFNRVKDWPEILETAGWTHVFDRGEESYWRRPGKDRDHSGTTNYQGTDVMKVFSSSTPFDPDKSYTKFAAYAVLHHNGDYKAAARAVQREMPKESRLLGVVPDRHDVGAPSDREPSGEEGAGSTEPQVRPGDSWKKVDLAPVLSGQAELEVPTILQREDGVSLFYAGRIHEIKGQPEAGKGWLALLACKQEIRKGNNVAYIDFEDYPKGVTDRLRAMGVSTNLIEKHFHYYHPEESLGEEAAANLFREMREIEPTICVVDSVAETMGHNSLDPMSNTDAATFVMLLPRPLANMGVTVILIDHVTKASDNNRYSVGAQHKLAAVSGSSFIVEAENPFGVGLRGSSKITVAKDRLGQVRKHAEGGKVMGTLVVHSNDDGSLTDVQLVKPLSMTIEGMEASAELMDEIATFIESQGKRSPSTNEIRQACTGRNEAIDLALDRLTAGGYLFRDSRRGRGGGFSYASLKPYRR